MATLNIKGFPDELYTALQERAARERRSVTQEVIRLIELAVAEPEPLSILELSGLGAELWRDIDAAKHVAEERGGWD